MTTKTATKKLPLPSFVKLDNAAELYYDPDMSMLFNSAAAWAKTHGIKPAGNDKVRVEVLAIDDQQDFCHPKGKLYVGGESGTGAIDDSKRFVEWLYGNMDKVTKVSATLDTHEPMQIFFSTFWKDEKTGQPVQPFTTITTDMIRKGEVSVVPAAAGQVGSGYPWLRKQVEHYTAELEKAKKYQLYIWPFHCQLGSLGYALNGLIREAGLFHGFVRNTQMHLEIKGGHPLTENYSVLSPEVLTTWEGKPLPKAQRNVEFIKKLTSNDMVVIAGQAASHCVKSSIDDLLDWILQEDAALAKKCYILEDCMSAVVVPNPAGGYFANYTKDAKDALKKFKDHGMNVVKSTEPMESWPGSKL